MTIALDEGGCKTLAQNGTKRRKFFRVRAMNTYLWPQRLSDEEASWRTGIGTLARDRSSQGCERMKRAESTLHLACAG